MVAKTFGTSVLRWVESVAVCGFLYLMIASYVRLLQTDLFLSLGVGLLSLPLSFYIADLLTGVVHWAFDTFGKANTPIWGPLFVAPFRRHHEFPYEITQASLAENLGSSCYTGILSLLIRPIQSLGNHPPFWSLFIEHFWLSLVVFSMLANLFHRWAHIPNSKRPHWLIFLQEFRVVLSQKEHIAHHTKPYRSHYCILCGWANPLLNRIPWTRVEGFMARIGIPKDFE